MVVCIDPNSTIGRIDPKLHGQFIEFLGECIDEGLWVGEDSPIENERGYRKAPWESPWRNKSGGEMECQHSTS